MRYFDDTPTVSQPRAPQKHIVRCQRGKPISHDDASHGRDTRSDNTIPVTMTESSCFTRRGLAGFLAISTRTLDRMAGQGLLPRPDLIVGSSPRWTPQTVARWLKSRPRIPRRKGGRP